MIDLLVVVVVVAAAIIIIIIIVVVVVVGDIYWYQSDFNLRVKLFECVLVCVRECVF